jgi:hypothetical protein
MAWHDSARQTSMAARRFLAEMRIEGNDAVHFGARQVQAFGDGLHGLGGNETQVRLHRVQDEHQGPRPVLVRGNRPRCRGDCRTTGLRRALCGHLTPAGACTGCQVGPDFTFTHGDLPPTVLLSRQHKYVI